MPRSFLGFEISFTAEDAERLRGGIGCLKKTYVLCNRLGESEALHRPEPARFRAPQGVQGEGRGHLVFGECFLRLRLFGQFDRLLDCLIHIREMGYFRNNLDISNNPLLIYQNHRPGEKHQSVQ